MNSFYYLARKLRRQWLPTISNSGIHNLSLNTDMPTRDLAALSLGLGFIPVPTSSSESLFEQYLHDQWKDFDRRVRVKFFFFKRNGNRHDTVSKHVWRIGSSTWMPDSNFRYPRELDSYLESVQHRLSLSAASAVIGKGSFLKTYMNPPWLMASLKSVRNNRHVIVTEADKNMGIVITDRDKYVSEGLRQLNDTSTYSEKSSVSWSFMVALFKRQRTILNDHGQLTEGSDTSRLTSHARYILQLQQSFETALQRAQSNVEKEEVLRRHTAKFYLLMKMHKSPVVGRPIVSTVNSVTYFASKYLDKVLQPLLPLIPSYIQSSQHLIYELEVSPSALSFPSDCVILCADIESLYPNIPTDIGLVFVEAAIRELGEQISQLRSTQFVKFLVDLLKFVLKNNYFTFGQRWFHQIKGTAMGTPVAVPFACLFVYAVEKRALQMLMPEQRPLFFRRYIDDVFCIFRSEQDAKAFLQSFGDHGQGLRFGSWTISNDCGIFLDLEIFKGPRFHRHRLLDFRTYQKAQNRYLYLAPTSFHRRSCLIGTIKSELDRYRLTSVNDEDFCQMKRLFYHRLISRGYNPELLDIVFDSHSTTRDQLISRLQARFNTSSIMQKKSSVMPVVFKTQFTPQTSQTHLSACLRLPETILHNPTLMVFFGGRQPINATSNAFAIQRYIGPARKHLHEDF